MGDSTMRSYVTLTLTVIFSALLVRLETEAKVFERCELAQLLQGRHRMSRSEVATLVCIAQHTSGFNTSIYGGGTGPVGGSHGIFQISDVYWCSTSSGGARGCNLACGRLRDDDITDDLACVRQIHADHQRISGDGYTAWQAYEPYCKRNAESYVADCLGGSDPLKITASFNHPQIYKQPSSNSIQNSLSKSKIYNRCELAQELYYKHKMPMVQIPTFVCIAQHESNFDTSAVGRLNADGSADHGLFQISDLYWCSHNRWAGGKACGLPCSKLLDSDITDDVRCVKRIYNEHEGISGDGFTAWTVYNRDCRSQGYEHVSACFNKPAVNSISYNPLKTHPNALAPEPNKSYANPFLSSQTQTQRVPSQNQYSMTSQQSPKVNPFLRQPTFVSHQQHPNAIASPTSHKPGSYNKYQSATGSHNHNIIPNHGKVYKRCELAQEMYFKHKFPIQDIPTWTCIAEHESRYDTSAVGRLNTDGSADHGLFQVSDLYWCTHDERGGKGCDLPCEKLLDSDITDDVKCIRTIHDEHTRISGDGFTAWVVYDRNCKKQTMAKISDCFEEEVLTEMSISAQENDITKHIKPQQVHSSYGPISSSSLQNHTYSHNIFLNQIKVENKLNAGNKKMQSWTDKTMEKKVIDMMKKTPVDDSKQYQQNPFLNNKNFNRNENKIQSNKVFDVAKETTAEDSHRYQQNPFLNNKYFNQNVVKMQSDKSKSPFNRNAYEGNPFLSKIPNINDKNTKNVMTSSKETHKPPTTITVNVKKNPIDNKYLNSESFRKTSAATTIKPITTTRQTTTTTKGTKTTQRLSSTTSTPNKNQSRTTFASITTSKPTSSTTKANIRTTSAIKTQLTTSIPMTTRTSSTSYKSRPTASSLAKKNNDTTTKTTFKPFATATVKYNWNTKVPTKIPVTLGTTKSQSTTTNKWTWTRRTTTKAPHTTARTPYKTTENPLSKWKWTSSNTNTTRKSEIKVEYGLKISKTTSKPLITKTTTKWPQTTSTVKRVETNTSFPPTTPILKLQNTNKTTTRKPDPFDHPFFAKYKLQFEKPIQNKETMINKTQIPITSLSKSSKERPTEKTIRIGSTTTKIPTTITKTTQRSTTTTKRPSIITSKILKGNSERLTEKTIRFGSTTTRKTTSTTKSTERPTTTTKRPSTITSEILKGSSYYEKFRNNTNEKSKTISVYGFSQNHASQIRRPEGTHDLKHKNLTTPNVSNNKNTTQSLFDLYLKNWNKT